MLALGAGGVALGAGRQAVADPVFAEYPFQLGIAAGDPTPDGFVIWTRLAPRPLEIGHGMPSAPVPVKWEVATDRAFSNVARRGEAIARPEMGHAVHVEVEGLQPGREYFYRFTAGAERTATGRAKTASAAGTAVARARFGVVGCQAYEQGFYTAHRKAAEEDLDFVYCYGDYIYEGRGARIYNGPTGATENPRRHFGGEIYALDDYRRRYAQYKMDADLQASHASTAWFCTWDDHETDNNWAAALDQDGTPPEVFALRRQAAAQAYYENMPLRRSAFPRGADIQLYRHAAWGDLLDLNFLDTRQYRSDQPCDDAWATTCAAVSADAQMLGEAQEAWLYRNLDRSRARWKVLAQQVMVMDLDRREGPEPGYNLDSWAGYSIPRRRLLQRLKDRRIGDTVVLTGDEHQNYAGELHLDGRNPEGSPIATEFVTTSISSGGDGMDQRPDMVRIQAANPQLKFNNYQRGYVVCDVTPERWQTEFKVLDKVSERGGTLSTRAKLAVASGDARVVAA
ncbi:alkaline phosphatase D family protein [uncultured Brevundimonas sp.]|uniref:alkaline phosphatase D family protein n=1 Tax=uncultured Brevundimonas sp. TaxID=213418 RepID=UPI00262C727F|nr:alkaline phosphatase D family protein [uncultured Brevundimonas sp.]